MGALTENKVIDICFCNSTIKELNEIIETELLKSDADLELIDECCRVLELINEEVTGSGFYAHAVHSAEAIIRTYNAEKYKKIILSASCAVLLGTVVGVTLISGGESKINRGENLKGEATENIKTESFESTSKKTLETEEDNYISTTQVNRVKTLKVMQPYDNRSLIFDNRSSINLDNFYIYVEMLDGRIFSVIPSECQYEVLETAEDGATRVKVTYNGYETFIYVAVSVPEMTTTEFNYDYNYDWDCDCNDDVFEDDYMFTDEETSAKIEETNVSEVIMESENSIDY